MLKTSTPFTRSSTPNATERSVSGSPRAGWPFGRRSPRAGEGGRRHHRPSHAHRRHGRRGRQGLRAPDRDGTAGSSSASSSPTRSPSSGSCTGGGEEGGGRPVGGRDGPPRPERTEGEAKAERRRSCQGPGLGRSVVSGGRSTPSRYTNHRRGHWNIIRTYPSNTTSIGWRSRASWTR